MNDDNDGVVKCQKNSTTPPRCHSDQVDPLVEHAFLSEVTSLQWVSFDKSLIELIHLSLHV